jgi:EAL domain-containing protein (putative c-di-GMP-specific phosphodiesterase class I)
VAAADGLRGRIARLLPDGAATSASAGVALFPVDAADATALFEAADGAVAWAKRDGRDRTRRYDPTHVRTTSIQAQREEILALLRRKDAMQARFQPLVALHSGAIVGYEALTRFGGVAGGPERWFAQARRCGLAGRLEARAIGLALSAPDRPAGAFVSVNVSPSALLSDEVMAVMPEDLRDVVVELTEHEVADAPELGGRLDELRRRGARIAVDDAGAGHAGLQQVMRVRPDIIKLDRALVDGVAGDPARAALIECFVAFARRTGAAVCAEGIESFDDLRAVAALDVHFGQGYGLARPAPTWAEISPDALRALHGGRVALDVAAPGR